MRPTSPIFLYTGIAVTAMGFVLIAMTWGRVAPLDSVALQLPHLVSGGLTGLGLIIIGAVMLNVHAKRREAAQRERQTQQLLEILRRLPPATDDEAAEPPNAHQRGTDGSGSQALDPSEREDPAKTEEMPWSR